MMFSKPSPRNGALVTAIFLSACGQPSGTDTGNPVVQRPPYESPTEFNPNDPTPPACPPPTVDTSPRRGPYWANAGETIIVGAEHRAGLHVLDVSDAQAPSVLATLPLEGNVLALVASGSDVAMVVEEPPSVPTHALATSADLALVLRLVHFDVSDPGNPTRVGDVAIDGEYWDLRVQGDALWLMTAEIDPPNACLLPGQGCGYVTRTAMKVHGYRFAAAGFEGITDVELPMSQRAWATAGGFVAESGSPDNATHRLSVARIVGDSLAISEFDGNTSPGYRSPVGVVGDKLYVLSDAETSSTLEVIDISGAIAQTVSQVAGLPARPQAVTFEAARVIVGNPDYTQAGAIVTLDDPTQPVVTPLPAGVAQVMPVEVNGEPALLGWGDSDDSGTLTIGLVADSVGESSELLQALHTELPTNSSLEDAALYQPNTVRVGNTVAFLYRYYEPTARLAAIGVLDLSRDPIALSTHEANYANEIVTTEGWAYAPGFTGMTAVSLDPMESANTEVALEFDPRLDRVDALPAGERTLSIVRALDGEQLIVTDGTDPDVELARWNVPNGSRRLLRVGNLVAVLADATGEDCEQFGLTCDEPSVVSVDPEQPQIIGEWPLPNSNDLSLDATSTQTNHWLEPVRLASGDWVLALQQTTECWLGSECERLDVEAVSLSEANIAPSSGERVCPPGEDPCELPPPPPEPEVYGRRATLDLYLLDAEAVEDANPSLTELGRSTLELLDSTFAPLRTSGNAVLVTRLELERTPGQSSAKTHARFMLDAFDADAPATASLPTSVNIPGIALGLSDDGQVIYTAEPPPAKNENATLYRLQMSDGEALVTAKRTLPGRYGDVRLFGDVAYYIEQGADSCTPGALHAIALDETLTPLGNTALTGGNWRYRESDSDKLLLAGPNYDGYALFDTTQTPAVLVEFQPAASAGEFVHIHNGELWSAGRR